MAGEQPVLSSDLTQRPARIGIIDLGSNSIRLVVYSGLDRVPLPLFNEKVACGLAVGVAASGRLEPARVEVALRNLRRFVVVAHALDVDELVIVATAAARDADNGPEFLAEVEATCGQAPLLLSGVEEARLSGLGVLSGQPEARGLMGDLGGGSLELVELAEGELQQGETLPLGTLRLIDQSGGDLKKAESIVAKALDKVPWLGDLAGRTLFPVGGAWRAIARMHMAHSNAPLRIIQSYRAAPGALANFAGTIARQSSKSLNRMEGVSRRRLETAPVAALVMRQLIQRAKPRRVVFSTYGLREGVLFDRLEREQQRQDPLLVQARELAQHEARFVVQGEAVALWTDPLFHDEKPSWRRLRVAACLLADLVWRDHPDYRAGQALSRILAYPFAGLDHAGRVYLATALFVRYGGKLDSDELAGVRKLLSRRGHREALKIGLALRLAFTVSAGAVEILGMTRLSVAKSKLTLQLPVDGSVPLGEAVTRRLESLAQAMGLKDSEVIEG